MNKLTSVIAMAAILVSANSFAGDKIDETIETNGKGRISIDVMNGKVDIKSWDKQEFKVVGELSDDAEGYRLESHNDGDVFFKVEMPEKRWGNWSDDGSMLEIYVPATTKLQFEGVNVDVTAVGVQGGSRLNTVNGDVTASELSKRVKLETVNGEVTSTNLSGKIYLETVNGSIKDTNSSGELYIETVNGDIRTNSTASEIEIGNVNGDINLELGKVDELEIGTVNGDLDVTLALAENGKFAFSSVGGDADIYFADSLSATINVETHAGGDIDNYLTDDKVKEAKWGPGESIRFTMGAGGADVDINTVSGDVKLKKKK